MSGCHDKRFPDMLWAYEVGLLDDDDRRALELHVLECEYCREDLKQFSRAAQLIKRDPDIHQTIHRLAQKRPAAVSARRQQKRTLPGWWRPAFVPAALVAAAVFLVFLLKPWQIEIRTTQEAAAVENRLAIMYFDDLAGQEQFGKIATNLLITDLSESAYLEVISSQRLHDILKLQGRDGQRKIDQDAARQVADAARAELIILGSILQIEPHFVLTAQLIKASTGNVIDAQRITGEPGEDIFSIVDRLSTEIKKDLSLPTAARHEPDRQVAEVTTHSPQAYLQYLEGVELLQKYYHTQAREHFIRAVELDSTFAMAYYYLAESGDPEMILKAEEFIDRATLRNGYYIRSYKAAYFGDPGVAINELQELLERYPEEKKAHYLLGQHFDALGNYDLALEHLQRALKIDPLYRPAVNYLAYFYDRIGEYEQAIVTIDSYISLAPDEPNPYDSRGDIYGKNGRIDLAMESFRKALEINPKFLHSIWKLGHLHCIKSEYAQAESLFAIVAASTEADFRTAGRMHLQCISVRQGKFAQALDNLDSAIAADYADGEVTLYTGHKHFIKARVYAELGDFERAKAEFPKHMAILHQRYPNSRTHERHHYAQLLAESGDLTEAEDTAQSLKADLEARGYELDYYRYATGCIALAKGNPEMAVKQFEKITAAHRDFPERFMLARAYQSAGQLSEAVAEFEPLLAFFTLHTAFRNIWDVKVHYYLALAYEKSNWHDKAIEQYEIFLDIWKNADPGIEEIDDAKARLAQLKISS
ncbi:tetratricopeptide repeat protein [Candidatus Zixiibacteriota bacterium]